MQNNALVKSKERVKFTSIVEAVAANVGKTLVWNNNQWCSLLSPDGFYQQNYYGGYGRGGGRGGYGNPGMYYGRGGGNSWRERGDNRGYRGGSANSGKRRNTCVTL